MPPPGNWQELQALDAGDLLSRLLENIDLVIAERADEEDVVLAQMPEALRVLHYLNWLDFEVTQGALSAYFMNSHGRHAPYASAALRRIGATAAAETLEQASDVVHRHAQAWAQRREDLDSAGEFAIVYPYRDLDGSEELDELTDRFRDALDDEDWGEKLERYLADELGSIDEWARG